VTLKLAPKVGVLVGLAAINCWTIT